jgi:phosphopantothenoylcysteine decarboxylase/phosphopantothenate--cysteine ligase
MKILLGVSGGIAAYKAVELTREFQRRGVDVQVVMTEAAERFITPLTFASISGRQVLTSLWRPLAPEAATGAPAAFEMDHITAGQNIDAYVIAPASANTIAKLAHGAADDLLCTIVLATTAPLFVAPAMNVNMWRHAATQANLETLRTRGVQVLAPGAGYLACGMVGEGRLAEPHEIADAVLGKLATAHEVTQETTHELLGETILITAGGTREPIDPVRYIGNRSSGKMGHALAASALARGAHVILMTTTASPLPASPALEVYRVDTAAELHAAALAHLPRATAVIMAAAVADYRVAAPSEQKLKKTSDPAQSLTLELVRNDDIVRSIVEHRRPGTLVIGFAAETENLLAEGRRKLREKGLDAIVANDVSSPTQGIDSDRNAGVFLTPSDELTLPLSSKRMMADRILAQLPALRASQVVRR